ncbi:GNAT family N-acetyltransferase [Mycolicibacterium thermoresistibile]
MTKVTTANAESLAGLELFAGYDGEALRPLAALLRPLTAEPGTVLMHQGEPAVHFLLIGSGRVEITHTGPDGAVVVTEVGPGVIVGEISLLRNAPRTATVVAAEPLSGWIGDREAFSVMLGIPGFADTLVKIARQRLASFITPIPVRMRDRTRLFLRPVLPGDEAKTREGHVEFSNETLYRRFMSMGQPNSALMHYLFAVDYVDHFVWVLTDTPDGVVVADGRFVRDHADPGTAEVAFLVADDYQGRGVGSFLMDALAVAATCAGVQRFTAQVLVDNYPMRRILDRFGVHWEFADNNVVSTVFDVPRLRDLSLSPRLYRRIYDMARQVVRAVG